MVSLCRTFSYAADGHCVVSQSLRLLCAARTFSDTVRDLLIYQVQKLGGLQDPIGFVVIS
jgi:hypothetical protein